MTSFTYSIDSADSPKGVSITLNGKQMVVPPDEINYLLTGVDAHATANPDSPPVEIGFMLQGRLYMATNAEWACFIDELTSAAGLGGWYPS
jgi:hypothetical protein